MDVFVQAYRRVGRGIRRIVEIALLFAALRLVLGLALLLIFDRAALAWGSETTVIVITAVAVYLAVGLSWRRWAE